LNRYSVKPIFEDMKKNLFICLLFVPSMTIAQANWKDTSKVSIPEFKKNLNASGSHYLKGTFLTQAWARYSEMNPGTLIDGTPKSMYGDIGIRRWRMQAFGQVTDRIFFYTQFGVNNFTVTTPRHTGAFMHDAVTEYKICPQVQLGMGLTAWSGMSRFSAPAATTILGFDAPLYQQTTNGVNDQFVRKLSIYAKGQVSKLDYRIAISSPLSTRNSVVPSTPISQTSSFVPGVGNLQTSGYLFWQFFDKENNAVPYLTGTYLGKKTVLNFGAGWVRQKDALWNIGSNGDTVMNDLSLYGIDLFLDVPAGDDGSEVSYYLAANAFDFGRNYIRNNNDMNIGSATDPTQATVNGSGMAYPMIGTGITVYQQFGVKFRDGLLPDGGTLMPYIGIQRSNLQALDDPATTFEAGVNWLIHGTHAAKITLGMQSRPIFTTDSNGDVVESDRRNMYVLQYQISL